MPEEKESLLSKFFAINSKPTMETFPELPDMIVWFRCILAVAYGLWLGLASGRTGGANVIFGLNFVSFVPVVYCSTFLGADSESYNNKLLFAGLFNAMALLLLIWIYLYTLEHEADEHILSAFLSKDMPEATLDTTADSTTIPSEPIVEESEF